MLSPGEYSIYYAANRHPKRLRIGQDDVEK